MKVFHGSYLKINSIDLNLCQLRKDFGRGFYVTKFREQAETWANRKGRNHHTKGIVTEFNFFESAFIDYNFNSLRFDGYNNEWLDFVALNRNFNSPVPAHDYDIVEGPVADDKITTRIDAYIRGEILKEEFLNDLSYEEETHQICFCTLKSLSMLEQSNFEGITSIERASEKIVEQLVMEKNIPETEASDYLFNSETYVRLTDISSGLYKKEWTEIYKLLKKELEES
jgi:hypothetical protein